MRHPAKIRFARVLLTGSILLSCRGALVSPTGAPCALAGEIWPEVMSERFSGTVVTLFLDRELVQSWLPDGLQLHERSPFEDHPVIILFGSQRNLTRRKLLTIRPRFGRHYRETFIAIPYLKLRQHPGGEPVFHFARVYVDNTQAANRGIRRFGWAKICVPIYARGKSYRIVRKGLGTILDAETDYDRSRPVEPGNDSLRRIRRMLSQPLVLKRRGRFDRYAFDFHFDTAKIRAVSTKVRLGEGFMPRLEPMEQAIPGIDRQDFGAFAIECRITKVRRR